MHQAACEHYLLVLQIILVTQTTQALPENIDILTLLHLRNFSLKYPYKCKLAVQRLVEASKINTCMQESAESRRWHSFGTRGKDLIIITIAQIYITFELQIQSFLFFWKFFHITLPWWGLEFSFKIMHQILRCFLNMSWTFYQCFKVIW